MPRLHDTIAPRVMSVIGMFSEGYSPMHHASLVKSESVGCDQVQAPPVGIRGRTTSVDWLMPLIVPSLEVLQGNLQGAVASNKQHNHIYSAGSTLHTMLR